MTPVHPVCIHKKDSTVSGFPQMTNNIEYIRFIFYLLTNKLPQEVLSGIVFLFGCYLYQLINQFGNMFSCSKACSNTSTGLPQPCGTTSTLSTFGVASRLIMYPAMAYACPVSSADCFCIQRAIPEKPSLSR